MSNSKKKRKANIFMLCIVALLTFGSVAQPLEVSAAHTHKYTTVVKYNKCGFVKHNKTLKCSCGKTKKVKEYCSGLKQVGGIKGYYNILAPGKPGKPHSHNMKCAKCKGISNMGCEMKSCK